MCDEGIASAVAKRYGDAAAKEASDSSCASSPNGTYCYVGCSRRADSISYSGFYAQKSQGCSGNVSGIGTFYFKGTCADRNQNKLADAAPWYSQPSSCIGGCQVQGTPFDSTSGGVKIYGMKDRTYNGKTCVAPNGTSDISKDNADKEDATKKKEKECTALGSGQTACLAPNGDYCATSSTGKTFCWAPNETGKKTDGSDAQVKSPKGEPVTPPSVTIKDQEWQRNEGHQNTACVNNTCTTYNVTNYSSVPSGTSKNSTGDNSPDGSGNSSGNGGKDAGSKDSDKDTDSASDSGNCTAPPACVGDTLKCLQLKFTWKIQCNTDAGEVTAGTTCADSDIPVCAGAGCKSAQYAQVLQQWRQRCGMEAIAQGMANRAAAISNPDDEGVVDGIWNGKPAGSGLTLSQSLVSVGGGGSLLPDVSIEGHQWVVPQGFYDAIAAIRMVIIAMCTVMAMFIVGRNI
ncbi:A coat protein [Xanthomonas sp. LMG 12460]|uniref:A coat protein n=1 Tax=Xanthomonas sp. LMG 12460 TaxID=1591132 RepID=UPI001D0447F7|nr:A coat protein [Xanthomonas sp. LMG 12460]